MGLPWVQLCSLENPQVSLYTNWQLKINSALYPESVPIKIFINKLYHGTAIYGRQNNFTKKKYFCQRK